MDPGIVNLTLQMVCLILSYIFYDLQEAVLSFSLLKGQ